MNATAAAAAAAPGGSTPDERGVKPHEAPPDTPEFGMWVFLASEILFFGGLLVAYAYGRLQWPTGFGEASRHTDVVLGTLNTAVLLTSSALVAFAVACGEHPKQRHRVGWLLAISAALGLAFLVIKGFEYRKEWHEHLFPGPAFELSTTAGAELFFALYFFMTALHALHLFIGVCVLNVFAWGSAKARAWATPRRVEIAALYWHFVDIVWIFLYPLLYLVSRHS